LARNLKRRRGAKPPLCLQPTRTPTERIGRQTPALVASDASAEVRPGPSEPPQPLSSILSGSVSELIFAPIKLVEAKNAAQISSGRARNYDAAGRRLNMPGAAGERTANRAHAVATTAMELITAKISRQRSDVIV
jgi:hypothetical protein